MRPFRDRSIGQKLTLVGMLASSVALFAASAAFLVYEFVAFRNEVVRRLTADAEIVGANTASALLFNDPEAAERTLAALGAEPHVRAAGVYDAQGRPFATYHPEGADVLLPPFPSAASSHRFQRTSVELFRPILFEGSRIGTVFIRSDLGEMSSRLVTFLGIMAAVSLGSFLLSVYISTRVQRLIAAPLLRLADTARTISRDRDYSVRAEAAGADEVGTLIGTFNEMLDQIRQRDADLQQAHASLEQRVEERTAALRGSQAQLAEAQRIAQIGSWERELATDRLTWSDEMYRMYGLTPGTDVPPREALQARIHPDDREMARQRVDRALADGQPFGFDYRLLSPDGTTRVVHADGRVILDDAGRPARIVGTAHDITERTRAEEERATLIREQAARAEAEQASRRAAYLAEAGAALTSTLDVQATLATLARLAVPELAQACVVFTQGAEGELHPAAAQHAEAARAEWLWERVRTGTQGPEARAAQDTVMTGRAKASPGPDAASTILAVPLRARDHTFGALVLISPRGGFSRGEQDLALALAERAALAADNARLYREAQQANRMKDEFLATLSHELRTPLNAIVGWTKLLQSGALDPETAKRAVSTIDRNAKAQTQLIEDILDVSRIVAGKVNLKVAPLDLAAVAEAALDSVRHAAEAKGITLHAPPPGTTVPGVRGDADRLQQVVWNLLSNAIKFTPRGGNVWLRLGQLDGSADVEVRDDGQGIRQEFLPHVFERFRQSDSSSTRPHGGLGLGLAIARHLVELHGGTVEVSSDGEGCGATFRVRLPMAAGVEAVVPRPAAALHMDAAPRLSGVRVLVVEDEPDTRELVKAVLGQLGAEVTLTTSATEALRAIDREPPDVLLSDIEMPDIDGYALMRTVRERPADKGGLVPAAALTAYARAEDRLRALRAGYQVHLAKPVEPAELAAVVASLAGRPGAS
jgi:PAS domain S-box-containing protein